MLFKIPFPFFGEYFFYRLRKHCWNVDCVIVFMIVLRLRKYGIGTHHSTERAIDHRTWRSPVLFRVTHMILIPNITLIIFNVVFL